MSESAYKNTPGDVCEWAAPDSPLGDLCLVCKHVWALHSSQRGCAGCEAIAEAIKAAREATNPAALRRQRRLQGYR